MVFLLRAPTQEMARREEVSTYDNPYWQANGNTATRPCRRFHKWLYPKRQV
ncbi:MAG: hypothetical protein LBK01_07800 [Burkholderiaceae bacterium]|nr:hypothetical protein [Burkholderiaceae bacterium]